MSNKAMPGLLKVGFSTKDPILRSVELGGTGHPHPFVVEYDALVVGPREIEQKVHELLSSKKEAKEYFRLDLREAIGAIRETLKTVNREALLEQQRESLDMSFASRNPTPFDAHPGAVRNYTNHLASRGFTVHTKEGTLVVTSPSGVKFDVFDIDDLGRLAMQAIDGQIE